MGYILDVLFPLAFVGWIRFATLCSLSYSRRLMPVRIRCNSPIWSPGVAWVSTLLYLRSCMEGSMFNQISIVGAGRIGQSFTKIRNQDGIEVVLLRRGDHTPLPTGPIVVCTRNDDLQAVLDWVPSERRRDLIFVQNGMLQTWLAQQSLDSATQALLYIAVSRVGEEPVDGGRSVVTGPRSADVVDLMKALNLSCRAVTKSQFLLEMLEKLLWNCVFGLLCQVYDVSVGSVVEYHRDQVRTLTVELLQVACTALNLELPSPTEQEALIERLCEYSLTIASYKGAVKEWKWRNGWFWDRQKDDESLHAKLLGQAGLKI